MNNENLINRYRKSFIFTILTLSTAANFGFAQVVPDLTGVWDGTPRARPVNSETVPWGEDNFPKLNKRAMAYLSLIHI